VAQAGVKFVPGLGGAAGVQILDDMWGAIQQQNHLALELGWQNRFHLSSSANAGIFWRLRSFSLNPAWRQLLQTRARAESWSQFPFQPPINTDLTAENAKSAKVGTHRLVALQLCESGRGVRNSAPSTLISQPVFQTGQERNVSKPGTGPFSF
jgi:hypothetical protein